jgi:DNA-binding response OmpR family regulator
MVHEALVIDDDPGVLEVVADILDSLGHKYDQAASQEEARKLLTSKKYSYYLLDLEIPVRSGRGASRIQNGENLLVEIVQRQCAEGAPVIVMTGHGLDRPELAVKVMKIGAADFVGKPFPPTGNTLDKAIREALARRNGSSSTKEPAVPPHPRSVSSVCFRGGELVFCEDRVELCGVTVVEGHTRIHRILEELRGKRSTGEYMAQSGAKLAKKLGTLGGQNAIAESIKHFRDTVTERLKAKGIVCGRNDVILSSRAGYRLAQWIVVRKEDE